ncbi:MAG: hypothetical protein WBA12_09160 [Catalinimonas sp.]
MSRTLFPRSFGWLLLSALLLTACGGGDKFQKSPVDLLLRDMIDVAPLTIVLYDMEVEGNFSKTYRHRYRIVTERDSVPQAELTDWYEVDRAFFERHEEDMGMEIAGKSADGTVTKQTAPPGYSQYVGNEQYGRWQQGNGGSFWEFYGKYALLSSVFNTLAYPPRRSYWNDYRGGYYGTGRSYYGPTTNGRRAYGTYSDYNRRVGNNRRYTSTSRFQERVRSRTARSSSASGSSSSSPRTSRSGSRYSGSSSRSRGGGFGK